MAYVTITKDLTEVKDKVAFGLTKRQIVCFSLGGIAGVGTYFLTRHSLGNDFALLLLIALAAPFMLFGLYEKNGQPLEKILKNIIRVRLLAPAARPYQTNNRFAALERQARYEKEVQQLVSIQNKATGKNSRGLGTSHDPARHQADRRRQKACGKGNPAGKKEGKIAKTAQQTIPYEEMYPDGICRITNRLYSKSVLCDDINYAEASDDEKAVLFELYCKLVNYFGPSVGFELSVICYPADLVEYRKMLALNPQGDQFDEIRKEYSDMLVRQVSKSRYERRICLTYTIEADGIRQARSRLEQIDNDVVGHFRALTVAAHPMDGYERLTILHRCLHLEENRKFRFNWDSLNHTGLSSKDYIAPSSFFFKDGRYFRSGASFGAVSFCRSGRPNCMTHY